MKRRFVVLAVWAAAFLILGWNIQNVWIGSGTTDSVSRLGPQDEAVFAHEAMSMVARNDWLTPVFLDRYVLFKPPLLLWLAGGAAKLAGASPFTLRFPVLAASAVTVTLLFLWLWRMRGWFPALAAAALLVSNEIWHSLSRLCMTDVLLGAFDFGALFCLGTDPAMERPLTVLLFSLLTAVAILTKSVAGTAPLLMLFLFAALARKDERPSWGGWHAYAA